MHKTKKQWLGSAILSLLLIGCGEGSDATNKDSKVADSLVVNSTFAATYLQTIEKEQSQQVALRYLAPVQTKSQTQAHGYDGKLEVTNILTKDKQVFDWPMTQKVDSEGNVETISHRALTLKPGSYDFVLLLTSKDGKQNQYMAEALGEEIIDGETPEIDFVLLPNLGDTISDFGQIQYVSTLKFSWPAEDLVVLSNPQFGLSINGKDETVYTINKETGIAELIMNVEPGEYQLAMRLYDGDLMVGKNEDQNNSVNFVEGEDAKMDVIPLQADVNLNLTPLKDKGTFTFTVPAEVVNEVGSAQELALIVRLGGDNVPVQEKVLTVRDENGIYKASDLFETGGQDKVTAYLAFHKVSEASEQFNSVPFASCNTSINVELNQTLGCKLELKRESIVTGRVLGTLMLNVLDQDLQPAIGVKVYVGDKLIGLTGDEYSTGSIKAHLVAGEYNIKAEQGILTKSTSLAIEALSIVNKVIYLNESDVPEVGNFQKNQFIEASVEDHNSLALVDVDNDGDLDVVYPGPNANIYYLENDGTGQFSKPSLLIEWGEAWKVVAADIDGDGDSDLLLMDGSDWDSPDPHFHQLYINNNGHFTPGQKFNVPYLQEADAKFSDIDGDGDLDLVTSLSFMNADLRVFTNNGKGIFEQGQQRLTSQQSNAFTVADVNGDKAPDIITGGAYHAAGEVLINNGKGDFDKLAQSVSINVGRKGNANGSRHLDPKVNLLAADFDNDGDIDLFATQIQFESGDGAELPNQLYINDGEGTFYIGQSVGVNGLTGVATDLNNDGLQDIIVMRPLTDVGSEEVYHAYINQGNETFSEQTIFSDTPFSRRSQQFMGDLNDDGHMDVVMMGDEGFVTYLNTPVQ
ncbi:VCBS repeat-containing protein [Photobacterium sp. SDRW27]|uniref:FG-GAP repeat domain-containing protein n=1 Tax=Photobacterium obscurum TaxID=2829490 RepID=UPI002244F48D|nr:VCBS repeat-containing protein [Photobacterium obscurum]MCW8331293.1 VCBS repeat-containing protein [Photobacterium obscurum]